MKRVAINNIIILVLYFLFFLALDLYHIKLSPENEILFAIGEIVILSFPIASFGVTWFSRYRRDQARRFLTSLVTALLVTVIGFLLIALAGIPFHMWISGAR